MKSIKIGQYILFVLFFYAVLCLLPILLILIASFSSERSLVIKGFSFFPLEWSAESWQYIITIKDQLIVSYGVTIFITVMGTLSGLLIISMFAYTLSRGNFKLKGFFSKMLLITMLFEGGQLSSYLINSSVYHLKDTLLILWIPGISAMYVFIMRTYIQGTISNSLIESSKIEGAGELRTFFQIVFPLMKPTLASIGFMNAVSYWNDWSKAYMYISSASKTPLQLLLIRIEKNMDMLKSAYISSEASNALSETIPEEGTRMAILFVVLGPIMIIYPFFQKYFVKGLTIGSVKG